jgi:hypothetical protein
MNSTPRPLSHHRPAVLLALAGLVAGLCLAPRANAVLAVGKPVVTTGRASGVSAKSATLGGTIGTSLLPSTYYFQYGPTTSYARHTTPQTLPAGLAAASVKGAVAGLAPRTVFHFRLVASNALGASAGADASFATPAAPPAPKPKPVAKPKLPIARTGAAGALNYQSATLTGSVNPDGEPTTYFFQYGPTTRYGGQSRPAGLAPGAAALRVASPVAGLVPVTGYHYRLVAVNAAGTALGADATFKTHAVPLSLAIGAVPSPVGFGGSLSVVGTLRGTGADGRTVVLQQNPYPFPGAFATVGNPELTSPTGAFSFSLLSLPLTTQFRVATIGAGQVIVSPTVTETVAVGVTMHVTSHQTRTGSYSFHFSGSIGPAELGGRVSVQRLVAGQWRHVATTTARSSSAGASSYSKTVRRRHGGFFRVYVTPVEGGHVAGSSQPRLVHAGATS